MSRSVESWVGATDDAAIPIRVRIRVFEAHGGRCWISGRKITPADKWDLDHKVALINGGAHAEHNLAPALRDKHREKTKADVAIKAKVARIKARHLGIKSPSRLKSRGFDKTLSKGFDGSVKRREVAATRPEHTERSDLG